MQTVGIRDLQLNPASFTKPLENNEFVMITKRGKPIGIATSFNDDALHHGLIESIVLKAFNQGDISLGQLSKSLKLTKRETMKYLQIVNIPLTNYDIGEDLKGIEEFL
ncbi:MAG: type II toxin-antitoxin system Phd/YefM family antitoxin [Sulfurovum sp.]|nr:type II toxin-antitoxin system Phd/YefM family antitoxin [Sulfurovum sp.]